MRPADSPTPPTNEEALLRALFRVPGGARVLGIGFFLAAFGACLDDKFLTFQFNPAEAHLALCCVWLAILLWFDREPPFRRRLAVSLSAVALTLLYSYCMRRLAGTYEERSVIHLAMWHSPATFVWAAALWLASPIWLDRRAERCSPFFRWSVISLCLYGSLCFASAVCSPSHKGLRYFTADRAVFLALMFAWLRAAQASPDFRSRGGRSVACLLAAVAAISAVIGVIDVLAGPALQQRLASLSLIYVENPLAASVLPRRRLLFPMGHFNRTASLALVGIMVLLVSHFRQNKKGLLERYGALFALPALLVILLTYTRGAIVAALAGLCLWCALAWRRMLIVLAAGSLIVAVCLPAAKRQYVLSAFRPSTYKSGLENMTTMKRRFLAWDWGLRQVRQHPFTGLGYGERVVMDAYRAYVTQTDTPENRAVLRSGEIIKHMHNIWLETAVESGGLAALALLAFCAARWALLLRNFVGAQGAARRRVAGWMGLELSLLLFGMVFYPLKESYGLLYWMVWAYCLSEAEAVSRAQGRKKAML